MKTKLTLLKKALFVAAGVFMLTACSDDDKAAGPGTTAEMAGDYKGTVTFRKPGPAGAISDGGVLSTAERMVNVQAVSATEVKFSGSDNTAGKVYSFDFNAKVVGISDGMILAADNVSYDYNFGSAPTDNVTYTGKLSGFGKAKAARFEVLNTTTGTLFSFIHLNKVEPEEE